MSRKYEGEINYNKHRKLYRYCHNYNLIENYEAAKKDNFKGWLCHHRLELIATGGVCDVTAQDLIDWGIYYNRSADELIFLTVNEHEMLHNPIGKRGHPQTGKQKIREWQLRNNGRLCRCIETGEVKYGKDWALTGYSHAGDVANGTRKSCKGLHFEYVNK